MTDEPLLLPAPRPTLLLAAPAVDDAGHGRRNRVVIIAIVVLATLLFVGWFLHHRRAVAAQEANERARDRLPSVSVVVVRSSPATADLRLPGTITALTEASLFARASGYVTARFVDIGDTVKRGQLLATIDSPDLDQEAAGAREQLQQARSAVGDAQARVELARVTGTRLESLVKDLAVSQQQVDQSRQDLATATAGLASSKANVGAAQANLEKLVLLQGYEKLRAPFDGVVTARNIDIGALINGSGANSAPSGSSGPAVNAGAGQSGSGGATGTTTATGGQSQGGTTATEMFRIAQADRVRVFVTVPQENANAVPVGADAAVFVQGFPEPFPGHVMRTARSLDPMARTLLTEVQVANPALRLVPGMYAQVRFEAPRAGTPLLVPGESVIYRASGLSVAVIEALRPEDRERLPKKRADASTPKKKGGDDEKKGANGAGGEDDATASDQDPDHARRVHLQQVDIGRDYGTEIEITRGLDAETTIVANPADDVTEGAIVIPHALKSDTAGESRLGNDRQSPGIQSPSQEAPTKGRK